tara:strand:+ start:558 stop:1976 length:1419 start_codon:yes stop_codon:yes gene_type:complete
MLRISNLEVHRGSRTVLAGVELQVSPGDILILEGANGSGKSTLIEACAGILPLTEGKVEWMTPTGGWSTIRDSEGRRSRPPVMGLTLQSDGICGEETVQERLTTSIEIFGLRASEESVTTMLSDWGLDHRRGDRVSQLSGGLRRRLSVLSGLAPVALNETPSVALLDEPSEGLDSVARITLSNWLGELSSRGHAIVMATHDHEFISKSTRVITIESGSISERPGEGNNDSAKLPNPSTVVEPSPILSLAKWAFRMEKRNPIDTIGRLTPAIVALLLSYSLVETIDIPRSSSLSAHVGNDLIAGLVLAPAFITAVVSPALVRRLSEDGCGRWWAAMLGPMARPANSVVSASIILPLPVTYISWFVLSGSVPTETSDEVLRWLWLPAIALIDVSCAASALYLMVSDLRRSSAVAASLLLVVLVWPFIELMDALSVVMTSGMSFDLEIGSPLSSCIIASLTAAMVWAVAVFLPEY